MQHQKLTDQPVPTRVLVVEDESLVRLVVCEVLENAGFKVLKACSGDEALRLLKRYHIDIVFTDVRMPGATDGFALADWVHKNYPSVPVFLASGDVGPQHEARIHMEPNFLAKPYNLDVLAERLRKAAAEHQHVAA